MRKLIKYLLVASFFMVFFYILLNEYYLFNQSGIEKDEIQDIDYSKTIDNKNIITKKEQQIDIIVNKVKKELKNGEVFKEDTVKRVLKIGETTFPIVFEDEDSSEELKLTIIKDMNLIFGHFNDYKILSKSKTVKVSGVDVQVYEFIYFKGVSRYWPDEYDGFGSLIKNNDEYHLVVNSKLADAYKEALKFKNGNEEVFNALDIFITNENQLTYSALTEEQIEDKFYFHNDVELEDMFRKQPDKVLNQFSNYRIRQPSLLDIKKGDEIGFSVDNGEERIFALTYLLNKDNVPVSELNLIYDKEKWKILFVKPGT